jgi:hypothetical protein
VPASMAKQPMHIAAAVTTASGAVQDGALGGLMATGILTRASGLNSPLTMYHAHDIITCYCIHNAWYLHILLFCIIVYLY